MWGRTGRFGLSLVSRFLIPLGTYGVAVTMSTAVDNPFFQQLQDTYGITLAKLEEGEGLYLICLWSQ